MEAEINDVHDVGDGQRAFCYTGGKNNSPRVCSFVGIERRWIDDAQLFFDRHFGMQWNNLTKRQSNTFFSKFFQFFPQSYNFFNTGQKDKDRTTVRRQMFKFIVARNQLHFDVIETAN